MTENLFDSMEKAFGERSFVFSENFFVAEYKMAKLDASWTIMDFDIFARQLAPLVQRKTRLWGQLVTTLSKRMKSRNARTWMNV